jgi:hypothetical protein
MVTQQQDVIWIDAAGRTRRTSFTVNDTGSCIRTTILGHSNADVLNWYEGPPNVNSSPAPLGLTYPRVTDYALLVFADDDGNQASLVVPAPDSSIFEADQVSVDASAIADLITAAESFLLNAAGNLVTTYLSGVRRGQTSVG